MTDQTRRNQFEEENAERLDADAVCAQCNTVNPEGTLLCRTCGNNLRDQRTMRMAAEQVLMSEREQVDRGRFLLGALTVLGILLVLYVVINIDGITSWLIELHQSGVSTTESLWTGPTGARLDEMRAELNAQQFTNQELGEALDNPAPGAEDSFEGFYAVGTGASAFGLRPQGTALVRPEGAEYLFVAVLRNGVEVRGRAQLMGNGLQASWETAAARQDGATYSVAGVALPKNNGAFDCYGQSDYSGASYEFMAGRLAGAGS